MNIRALSFCSPTTPRVFVLVQETILMVVTRSFQYYDGTRLLYIPEEVFEWLAIVTPDELDDVEWDGLNRTWSVAQPCRLNVVRKCANCERKGRGAKLMWAETGKPWESSLCYNCVLYRHRYGQGGKDRPRELEDTGTQGSGILPGRR